MVSFSRPRFYGLVIALILAVNVLGLDAQSTRARRPAPAMRTDAIARVARLRTSSVVAVHTLSRHAAALDPPSAPHVQEGLGSGVVIESGGLILTNAHVVNGANALHILTPDGGDVEATVIGTDPDVDLGTHSRCRRTGTAAGAVGRFESPASR